METKRQKQFSKLIQKELGDIFQKDVRHLFGNKFITVTIVRMSPDLGIAKAYLSFLLADNKAQALEEVEDNTKTIRTLLAKRIGKSVRIIPELQFYLDDTQDYVDKMDKLFEDLDIPSEEDE